MARPNKIGLDYFPFDVDFFEDMKVRKLIKRQGGKAVAVYALLLCFIYKNGYYIGGDEELPFIISEKTGYDEVYIQEVIKSCMSLGLLDKTLYENYNIITSKGIQVRYMEVQKNSNRKVIISEYNLVSSEETRISSKETIINSEETLITSEVSTQKEMKQKKLESSDEDSLSGESPPDVPDTIDYKKFVDWFNSETKGVFGIIKYPIGEKRKASIRARVREKGKKLLFEAVKKACESDFLKGNNQRGFMATFDWIINPSNFDKILSDNYKNHSNGTNQKINAASNRRTTPEQLDAAVEVGFALAENSKKTGHW
ncbi:MAG: DUF4373 domain-containing protein [Candidatus Azobacteroides sp.]|nr:DUF4373 domain-containing protein [Candidatus Azobacteroides sp.]